MSSKVISIIIPVYNEEKTVALLLDRVLAAPLSLEKELILVNDGSTDNSGRVMNDWLELHQSDIRAQLIHQRNGGKGAAVRTGIERSTGDVVIIQDADLEYNPCDMERCAAPIVSGRVAVVYGSRERYSANRARSSWMFYLGGLSVTMFFNMIYGSMLTDEPCCYKTFDGDLIRSLKFRHNGFGWEPEITGKLLRLGIPIYEVPVEYHPRKADENKKIKWSDGLAAFGIGLLERFRPVGCLRKQLAGQVPHLTGMLNADATYFRILNWIFLLALTLRCALSLPALLSPETLLRPDSAGYLAWLSEERAPLYPLLCSVFRFFCGTETYLLPGIALFGIVFSSLTVYPIASLGKVLGRNKAGIFAAVLFAINLTAIANSPLILADTLFLFAVAFQCFFWIRLWRYHRLFDFGWGTLFALIACLVKPANLPILLLGTPILIVVFFRTPLYKLILGALCVAFGAMIFLMPWMLFNRNRGCGFAIDGTGPIMCVHNTSAILAHAERRASTETLAEAFIEVDRRAKISGDRNGAMKQYYIETIQKYPKSFLLTHFTQYGILMPDLPCALENIRLTTSGKGTLSVIRQFGWYAGLKHYLGGTHPWIVFAYLPLLLSSVILYLFAGAELCCCLWRKEWRLLALVCVCCFSYLLMPGPVIMPRYLLPALPFLCGLAARFFCRDYFRFSIRSSKLDLHPRKRT